ncbi:MAG: hypothetical protein K6T33_01050 [Thermomonas hydrothermalis]|uniref:hypothetical protein n=1 Tax=Thermomonas hydrothermalis TaxID=213588 RepID=UPI002356DEFB|nr:hypothetical protein [Thermomonas hydrothermalis]MCL6618361.1 hypothetical protein [Thermomonas hydrothermalis]
MRKVFSSLRLENVEAVARLLRDAGIEVKIEHGRSYRGYRRGNFSYDSRKLPEQMPAVWIVRAEDQPRGRQILRELGLLEDARQQGGYLPAALQTTEKATVTRRPAAPGRRLKLWLLALIGAVIALALVQTRKPAPAPASKAPATAAPAMPTLETITDPQVFRYDVPTALVARLLEHALHGKAPAQACVRVDGRDPSPAVLAAARVPAAIQLRPASACAGQREAAANTIAIDDYMTDGSGSGEVTLTVGTSPPQVLSVTRQGRQWQIGATRPASADADHR